VSTEEEEGKKNLEFIYVRTIKYRNSTKKKQKKERAVQSNKSSKRDK
jgi:hypothetical protein